MIDQDFRTRVYDLVGQIPKGKVMTYGQIAALCGSPRAARIVGGIAAISKFDHQYKHAERTGLDGWQGSQKKRVNRTNGTENEDFLQLTTPAAKSSSRVTDSVGKQGDATCSLCDLPWQRVVKKDGSLAEGYPGGIEGHAAALKAEGSEVSKDYKVDVKSLQWSPDPVY